MFDNLLIWFFDRFFPKKEKPSKPSVAVNVTQQQVVKKTVKKATTRKPAVKKPAVKKAKK